MNSFNDVITAKSLKCVLFKLKNADRLFHKTQLLIVKKYDFIFKPYLYGQKKGDCFWFLLG